MLGNKQKKLFVANSAHKQAGFTLPELAFSVLLIGILSVSLLSALTYYFAYVTRNNFMADMTVNSQNLLRATVEEIRYGAGVRQINSISDPNAPPGGWNTSNANFVIIIASPAQDSDGDYIINPITGAPYNNELVYYKQDDVLYRRNLANPSATGNTLVTSCPAASASSSCPADVALIEYLDDMVFTLYDQDDAVTNSPLLARSVQIDLSMLRHTLGGPLTLENSIRVTLRNTF